MAEFLVLPRHTTRSVVLQKRQEGYLLHGAASSWKSGLADLVEPWSVSIRAAWAQLILLPCWH
jgi:hypothetical protein